MPAGKWSLFFYSLQGINILGLFKKGRKQGIRPVAAYAELMCYVFSNPLTGNCLISPLVGSAAVVLSDAGLLLQTRGSSAEQWSLGYRPWQMCNRTENHSVSLLGQKIRQLREVARGQWSYITEGGSATNWELPVTEKCVFKYSGTQTEHCFLWREPSNTLSLRFLSFQAPNLSSLRKK
jgi:hypothetical protein